ncbi:adenine nucleotide transporter BT1, chloroplastic/mitochondrial-like isoform X1 [Hevea brasiliensis]|uniref:adenine nucleotide transporter BT1, chloroplastic/mitochondrial-like isoform X1 n=1 Tax=Hevea brasiliensis TaxID=3981 RepID=UPI0025EE9BCD|nr:adenine nucleotide transporter BT1, chloroplastic/mitochondrial-like isoform X1 [Hevea brasiliensis]
MRNDGWKGLSRSNFVNVIRVAPSKAIELVLLPELAPHYARTLELLKLKTRLTVQMLLQREVYKNLFDAFLKIKGEEGLSELHRGLIPSLIGVVPYSCCQLLCL